MTKNFNTLKQELDNRQTLCIGDVFTVKGFKAIHIMFAEKPYETMRQTLKTHGFGWYPKQNTWSKKWTAEDEEFARTFVRQCNRSGNVANKTTTIIDFPKKSDAPKKQVKAVADTVKTAPKAVKKQVKAVKTVKTNTKKVDAVTERDGIKIGDVFVTHCGYSMSYYNFFKVIGFKGQKTVIFAPLRKEVVSGDNLCGEVVPKDNFKFCDYENVGIVEKVVKIGGINPSFKGKEYFFRHVAGHRYYENHLD